MVVSSPTCPPDSVPSTMTISAPACCIRKAKATVGTIGTTIMPSAFNLGMYLPGLPAPVVTNAGFISAMTSKMASVWGFIIMTLTPNGLSVSSRHFVMAARATSAGQAPVPMMPKAPLLLTAAANSAVAMLAMAPCMIGYLIPNMSFSSIFSFLLEFNQ